jgi:hypothetical protein
MIIIRVLLLMVLATAAPGLVFASEAPADTFYIQLIRGNNENKAPAPEAKPLGPKLSGRLHSVFKWEHYWEIKRESIDVPAGKSARKRVSPEREVEIDRANSQELTVRIFIDGKLARETRQPISNDFFISGGDKEGDQSWFIIVRRDKPQPLDGSGKDD